MAKKEASLLLKIRTEGEKSLKSVRDGIKNIGEIGAGVFTAMSALVVKAVHDFRQQEEATNALTQAMVNNGTYSKALRDEYLAQASALQSLTLFGDENIIAAQASLAQQAGGIKITKEMTMAILDFAQAQGIDAASAANLVGKSIGTATNALTRYGIEVNTAGTQSEKAAQVLEGLNKKFGGQAVAATDGLGAIKQLLNVISDLFETVGERLVPVISLASKYFINLGTDATKTGQTIDGLISVLHFATRAGTSFAGVFLIISDSIGIFLGSSGAALELFSKNFAGFFKNLALTALTGTLQLKGDFGQGMKDIAANAYDGFKESAIKRTEETNAALLAIDQAFLEKKKENEAAEAARVAEAKVNAAALTIENETTENTRKLEAMIAQQEIEMGVIAAGEEKKNAAILDAQIKTAQKKLTNATSANAKLAAMQEIHRLNELKKQQIADDLMVQNRGQTLGLIAGMQNSSNGFMAAAGKAAALTQIAIETPVAVARALSAFPPPFNFAAAGAVGLAMAAQTARVAGIPLAEGGLVQARPGGIQATIGEGGEDELVTPLSKLGDLGIGGGGNNITIIVNGGMLGDERTAHQLAVAIDQQLLKLRQNGESVSFDERIS